MATKEAERIICANCRKDRTVDARLPGSTIPCSCGSTWLTTDAMLAASRGEWEGDSS